MKISDVTLTILKNLAKFNNHIVIAPGNVLKTVNERKTTLIKAVVEEEFPVEIPLHDLQGFLKVVSLFDDPDFDFREGEVIISDVSGAEQQYQYSEKDDLIYDDRDIQFPPSDATVAITADQLKKVLKAAAVNGVEDVAVVGEGGKVYLRVMDKENPKRVFSTCVSEEDAGEFKAYLKHSKKGNKIDVLPLDYQLELSSHKIAKFTASVEEVEVSYIMALEVDSEF